MPEPYPWPEQFRGACVVSVDVDAEVPLLWRSRSESVRVAELEQRSFGHRVGLTRLLGLFAEMDVTASFYVPGYYADHHPENVAAIAEAGHEIGLHGYLHEPPVQLSKEEFQSALDRSTRSILNAAGVRPTGFRSPSWDMTADAFDVLSSSGLLYDSSVMGLDVPYRLEGIIEVPVQWTLDDAPFHRYVGGSSPGHPPLRPMDLADRWCDELDAATTYGTLAMLTVHDWLSGRATATAALARVLEHLRAGELWTATADQVARWHDEARGAADRSWRLLPEGVATDAL